MKSTMNTNGRTRIGRVVAVAMLLAVLCGMLSSCGGGGAMRMNTVTKNYEITTPDGAGHGLNATQLNTLADAIVANENKVALYEQLVAAYRGYDMNAAGFDDTKVPLPGETIEGAIEAHPEKAPEYLLTALRKAGIETLAYTGTDGEPLMTVADVKALVDCFAVKVDVDAKLGIVDQILQWIGVAFGWMIDVPGFGSFILGTVYFAIAIEIIMLPLGIFQQKNSRKQAKLRPREMAIRNKYKGRNDQVTMQKLNTEIQNLYQSEGYSPMAGCWPLLITMPFLISLYYIVIDPLTYMMGAPGNLSNAFLTFADTARAAGGLGITLASDRGTIEVLSLIREGGFTLDGLADFAYLANGSECLAALDGMVERIPDFTLFGLNMGLTPKPFQEPYIFMFIPVLTFVVYWGSGKISRKFTFQPMQDAQNSDPSQGCSNTMMNVMMPAMSAFFTFMVPAAVGLYWMFKSILGTAKQIIISKAMPLPVFTEEDYKAAERELAGKDKNKPKKSSGTRNPNVRSLHHIDDEDYESPAEREARLAARKADYVEPDDEPATRTSDSTYAEGVTLKEDNRPARKKKGKADTSDASDTPDGDA